MAKLRRGLPELSHRLNISELQLEECALRHQHLRIGRGHLPVSVAVEIVGALGARQ